MAIDLSQLNPQQRQAVLTTEGPIMILAGAGSGKTRTLVYRILHLLEDEQVPPWKILGLTFSNKAAREMLERVQKGLTTAEKGSVQLSTFHAFCARVLRIESNHLGLSRNFTIFDDAERKAVLMNILGRQNENKDRDLFFRIQAFIEDLKNKGYYLGRSLTPAEAAALKIDLADPLFSYFSAYENMLHQANAVDFGGLITGVIELWQRFPEVLAHYQQRYQYVLVDEYQDTNKAQFELLKMLTAQSKNLCVVGDEDQSIYSWRGADIHNILDFEQNFPAAEVIKLEQNYRSCKNIIDAASCVIAHNQMRKDKTMWTKNVSGDVVEVVQCGSDLDEARFVAQEIKELHSQFSYRQMAIFYRANAQSRLFEDSLRREGIPYRIVGSVMFYERKEVKDVLAYLRVVINPQDNYALTRIINTPARGIGVMTLRKLEDWAAQNKISLSEGLALLDQNKEEFTARSGINLNAKAVKGLRQLNTLLQETRLLVEQQAPLKVIFEKVFHESGLSEFYAAQHDPEAKARKENLQELQHALIQYELQEPEATLAGFLENVALNTDKEAADQREEDRGAVTLMTAHGAKGLEFACVFLVGAEENTFPSYKSLQDLERGVEEERRLFYVAMTRAMQRLFISYAQGRLMFGTIHYNPPSRFIEEIPTPLRKLRKVFYGKMALADDDAEFAQCADVDDYDGVRQVKISYAKMPARSPLSRNTAGAGGLWATPAWAAQKAVAAKRPSSTAATRAHGPRPGQKYWVGAKVKHGILGPGTIVGVEGSGPKEKVIIRFKNGDLRRFMAALAPLSLA